MTDYEELRRLATLLLDESHMNALSLSAMRDQSHDYQRATRPTVILELLADLERKDAVIDQRNAELSRLKSSTITHDEWYEQCNDITRKDALLRRAGEVLKAEYASEYDEALELAVLAAIEKELK